MISRNSSTRWSRNPIFGRAASFACANVDCPGHDHRPIGRAPGAYCEVVKRADDEILKPSSRIRCAGSRRARRDRNFSGAKRGQHVYWVERTGKDRAFLSLNAAPIDLRAGACGGMIFPGQLLLRSSTKRDARDRRRNSRLFRDRIGATEAGTFRVGSPSISKADEKFVVQKVPDPRTHLSERAGTFGSRISSRKPTGALLCCSRVIAICSKWR